MPSFKGLEGTFDTVVANYDKMRPGYAPELFKTIFDYVNIGEDSRVVEVGSGSGQATGPVLAKGCELISVEYGENFSKVLKEKFKDYPKFSVITGKFEEADLPSDSFDLVFLDAARGQYPMYYADISRLLANGGILISDNVLFNGYVAKGVPDRHRNKTIVMRLDEYLKTLELDERFKTVLLPISDGVTLSIKNM